MSITKDSALTKDVFHVIVSEAIASSSIPVRYCTVWKRIGKTKTWKRDTNRFSIPVKHGLCYGTIVSERDNTYLPEECPVCNKKQEKVN